MNDLERTLPGLRAARVEPVARMRRWDQSFADENAPSATTRALSAEDRIRLLGIEPFRSIDPAAFPASMSLEGILQNDSRIRVFSAGDVVMRQGDYGRSAFLVLGGTVSVVLRGLDPALLGRRPSRGRGWLHSLAALLPGADTPELRDAAPPEQERVTMRQGRIVVQDVSNVLDIAPDAYEAMATTSVGIGEMIGELSALGRTPRSASVVAADEVELLEIRWQGLRELRRYDEAFRQWTDDRFRHSALRSVLQATPPFTELPDEALERVSAAAELEPHGTFDWYGSYQELRQQADGGEAPAEAIIAAEGHYPDGILFLRSGFGRLTKIEGNGERTIGYLGKGDVYGLAEIVRNARSKRQGPYRTTLRALGYVDVVRIPSRTVVESILPHLSEASIERLVEQANGRGGAQSPIDSNLLGFLIDHRVLNGTSSMVIDLDRCTRCDDCVRACAAGHDGNPRFVRQGPSTGRFMIANACMHCSDPVCLVGCPTGAIHTSEERGEVVINDQTCIGCGTCADSCPYDNIRLVEVRNRAAEATILVDRRTGQAIEKATKCDLCIDHAGGPACVRACPHDALTRVDFRDERSLRSWLDR